jgi:hypothetical protein
VPLAGEGEPRVGLEARRSDTGMRRRDIGVGVRVSELVLILNGSPNLLALRSSLSTLLNPCMDMVYGDRDVGGEEGDEGCRGRRNVVVLGVWD